MQTDPSMEEILASIKRVIAEDNRAQPARARRVMPQPSEPAEIEAGAESETGEDVLELDDPVTEHGSLLSSDVAAASRARLAALTSLRSQPEPIATDLNPVEALVRDMLRPMLKEWLDENLPGIVESLVTREIARITGRKF
jgi:cell pole-organizing protein PopZ